MTVEEVGEKYFEDLTSRSLFLLDASGKFTMHDVVNDLAKSVSGDFCLRLDDNCLGNLTRKTRHISQLQYLRVHDIEKKLKDLSENKVLRTLLLPRYWSLERRRIIYPKLLISMQYLRVFSFCFEDQTESLKSVGSLKHLRFLDLSNSEGIKEIPRTIYKLYNLQTLLLIGCRHLTKLSDSIGNLKNLRLLNLSDTPIGRLPDAICNLHELRTLSLEYCEELTQLPTNITTLTNLCKLKTQGSGIKELPPKVSNLKNLQELPEFVISRSNDIEELGELRNLRGGLHIKSLENVEEVGDVSKDILMNKKYITDLSLEWNDDSSSDVSHHKALEVFDRLQPHTNVAELRITNYRGSVFPDWIGPDWIGHHSFSCIKKLFLIGCKNCDRLPSLGELPSLEVLEIRRFVMLERIGDEFYLNHSASSSSPPFKSLKTLRLEDMQEWKEWSLVGGAFPNLQSLKLSGCPKLKWSCLPDIYLPSLGELDIRNNRYVVASLSRCQFPLLRSLEIRNCGGMKSFPQGRVPSAIQSIVIWGCKHLVSLSEEGWPCSNLKSLQISNCEKLFAHRSSNKWNLGMLTSLTSLRLECMKTEGVDSFPEEEGQLPTTLTSLRLFLLKKLKSLNGTALRHLTSLQSLSIHYCEQLQCLAEEGLPASLSHLTIYECPLLKPRCQRGIGQDWDKIHHIPNISIDGESI